MSAVGFRIRLLGTYGMIDHASSIDLVKQSHICRIHLQW